MHVPTYTQMHRHTRAQAHAHRHAHVCICALTHMCVHICAHTHAHTCAHTGMHRGAHTQQGCRSDSSVLEVASPEGPPASSASMSPSRDQLGLSAGISSVSCTPHCVWPLPPRSIQSQSCSPPGRADTAHLCLSPHPSLHAPRMCEASMTPEG